jgi:hypothetical protein
VHCVDASVQEESGRQGQHDGASAVRLQTVVDPVPRTVRIEPLLAHPQHLPFVAGLVYREFWAGVSGGLTEEYLARAFGGHAEPGRVLRSWLALEEDEPLGCVHLIDHDDDTLPELYPWLAAMVVLPRPRRLPMKIPSLKEVVSAEEWALRVDLAAAYRLVALYGWSDLVFTHISARIPGPPLARRS